MDFPTCPVVFVNGRWIKLSPLVRGGNMYRSPNGVSTLLLEAFEGGGRKLNTGACSVIAGNNGEILTPLRLRTTGNRACAEHAYFRTTGPLIQVLAYYHRRRLLNPLEIMVIRHTAEILDGGTIVIRQRTLLQEESGIDEVVTVAPELQNAVDATWSKVICRHCQGPHYATVERSRLCGRMTGLTGARARRRFAACRTAGKK